MFLFAITTRGYPFVYEMEIGMCGRVDLNFVQFVFICFIMLRGHRVSSNTLEGEESV